MYFNIILSDPQVIISYPPSLLFSVTHLLPDIIMTIAFIVYVLKMSIMTREIG